MTTCFAIETHFWSFLFTSNLYFGLEDFYFLTLAILRFHVECQGWRLAIFHLGWFTEKGPHKSQKYTVFPTFYPSFYDLWGPFLGCQPKWKISIGDIPELPLHYERFWCRLPHFLIVWEFQQIQCVAVSGAYYHPTNHPYIGVSQSIMKYRLASQYWYQGFPNIFVTLLTSDCLWKVEMLVNSSLEIRASKHMGVPQYLGCSPHCRRLFHPFCLGGRFPCIR